MIDCWHRSARGNHCYCTTYKSCPPNCPFRETDFEKYTSNLEHIILIRVYLGARSLRPYLGQLREAYMRAGLRMPPDVDSPMFGLFRARVEDMRRGRKGGGGEKNSHPREYRKRDNRLPETLPTKEERAIIKQWWDDMREAEE